LRKIWENYNLAIVLAALFLFSWVGQFAFQMSEVRQQAMSHSQEFSWSEFWPEFGAATLENWQSEFLQLLSFVVLTSYLMYRGSPESRDSDEKLEQTMRRIEKQLAALKGGKRR
jgi:hypothetical protein